MNEIDRREDALFKHVADLAEQSRQHVKKAVDTAIVINAQQHKKSHL